MIANQKEYRGVTLTLTDTNTHNLYTLLKAADAATPGAASRVMIQLDSSDGGDLLVGDDQVAIAPLRCSYRLRAGDSRPYESTKMNLPLCNLFVRYTAGVSAVFNVEVQA